MRWYRVVGPAAMQPTVLKLLNGVMGYKLSGGNPKDRLAAEAVDPSPMAPEAFVQFIRAHMTC